MKKLVSLYQFNLLTEAEKISVEAHLLECDACFEEIYSLNHVMQVMFNKPDFFLPILQPKATLGSRIGKFLVTSGLFPQHLFSLISSKARKWWRQPLVKIVVPVTAIALLLLILLPINTKRYSDLAIIENASYLAPKFRGIIDDFTSSESLFHQGVKFFEEKKYEKAIQKLTAFTEKKKKDAYGHFYLGVSLLLTEKYKTGIDHLNLASRLSAEQGKDLLLEKCHWFLGNGYLKMNDVDKAIQEFQKVITMGGDFKQEAQLQLARIKNMR